MLESPVISHYVRPIPGLLPAIGFKEWALVCESMLRGETSLIFRKGGIAEGKEGFRFKHSTRLDTTRDLGPQLEIITIEAFAYVEFTLWISDLQTIEALSEFHILRPELLEKRFNQDDVKGVHLAFLRVFRVIPSWHLAFQSSFGGCRSWVDLPPPSPDLVCRPVLSDEEHERRRELVESVRQ